MTTSNAFHVVAIDAMHDVRHFVKRNSAGCYSLHSKPTQGFDSEEAAETAREVFVASRRSAVRGLRLCMGAPDYVAVIETELDHHRLKEIKGS